MSPFLKTAIEAAKAAQVVIDKYYNGEFDVEIKPDLSPVTIADTQTERAMRDGLENAFPGDAIFGEEFGQSGAGSDMWIIDPIDGTRSFITGLPLWGMLLGYVTGDGAQLGVIRMPALGEVYAGAKGIGASCNGHSITVSTCTSLSTARLFINEADKLAVHERDVFARLAVAGELRRMGSDCYPHALVAVGLADAVVDYDLQPYDYLPVSAVIEASGGIMTDWSGAPLSMASDGRTITAATPELHGELVRLLNG